MPGFDINSFIGNFNNGARSYLFYVFVNNPFGSLGTEATSYLVKSSTVPASNLDVAETDWQGNKYKLGTTLTFDTWSCDFKVDVSTNIHSDFITWQRNIHDPETNIHGDPSSYLADQHVWMLNGNGVAIKKTVLINAFPSSVAEISLDYSSKELATFGVTFTYQYFKNE